MQSSNFNPNSPNGGDNYLDLSTFVEDSAPFCLEDPNFQDPISNELDLSFLDDAFWSSLPNLSPTLSSLTLPDSLAYIADSSGVQCRARKLEDGEDRSNVKCARTSTPPPPFTPAPTSGSHENPMSSATPIVPAAADLLTYSHLSHQMTEAFSHVATNKNAIYNQTRRNIQTALQPLLPLIEELDHQYGDICRLFGKGKFPPKPEGIAQELMPYQWRGYKWMEIFCQFGIGGCLADEMGLGKTIQSLALVQAIVNQKREKNETARILISCPANLIQNWQREIATNCPTLINQVSVLEGKEEALNPICLISHQKLRLLRPAKDKAVAFPFNQSWDLILFDEFHTFLKSPASEQVVTSLRKQGRGFFGLTGTPMPNNLIELYKLNAMLNPTVYPKIARFKRLFIEPAKNILRHLLIQVRMNGGKIPAGYKLDHIEEYVIQLIEILTKPFLLRRLKTQEEFRAQTAIMQAKGSAVQSLPPLQPERRISYPLTRLQETLIQGVVGDSATDLETVTERGALSLFNANVAKKEEDEEGNSLDLRDYVCLQSIANHPATLRESEKLIAYLNTKNPQFERSIREEKVDYSQEGKLQTIMLLVKEILIQAPQDKILVFTNFESMGRYICEGLRASTLMPTMKKVEFLYGKVQKPQRLRMIQDFKDQEGPPVLVAGRKLGSVGWNCTVANHIILVDPWWNPNDDDQCVGRIYRIGQAKLVHVYRMHRAGFVADDKMDQLRIEKKAWCDLILAADVTNVQEKIREILEGKDADHSDSNSSISEYSSAVSSDGAV
jgi:SNF2 family DNA or RNA helicase